MGFRCLFLYCLSWKFSHSKHVVMFRGQTALDWDPSNSAQCASCKRLVLLDFFELSNSPSSIFNIVDHLRANEEPPLTEAEKQTPSSLLNLFRCSSVMPSAFILATNVGITILLLRRPRNIGYGNRFEPFRTFELVGLCIGYVARGSSLSTDAIYCLIGSEEVVPPPSGDDAVSETCLEHPTKGILPSDRWPQHSSKSLSLCFVCIFDNGASRVLVVFHYSDSCY